MRKDHPWINHSFRREILENSAQIVIFPAESTLGHPRLHVPGTIPNSSSQLLKSAKPRYSTSGGHHKTDHSNSEPLYNLHLDTRLGLRKGDWEPDHAGHPSHPRGKFYPSKLKETTTSLPKFLPDGPRPFMPDPSILPGDSDIRVLEGHEAVLPCTVQYLGARQDDTGNSSSSKRSEATGTAVKGTAVPGSAVLKSAATGSAVKDCTNTVA
ncbi:hypothetical protein PoB_006298900 [Plakobranchus ocellatus]|uniref:Uncharacterized protein n=1 Tax=Plakobranchus ocellatus TaxID=259542 RepID=A0AAV4CX50_9GAST|nr:hypothetical protein PoB_006298900 [Plakobranchus ocellatus]